MAMAWMPPHARKQQALTGLLGASPVLPVVTVDDPAKAVNLARALLHGGLKAIEVTLRSDAALACLEAIARQVPEIAAGAGTVLTPTQLRECESAGARFLVSPGFTPALLDAAAGSEVPLLPGAATPAGMMQLLAQGYHLLKFFPAMQAGGPGYLRAVAGPLPHLRFCPTGGVTAANAHEWLALDNVVCVGGSWVAPRELVEAGDFGAVEALAREAALLRAD